MCHMILSLALNQSDSRGIKLACDLRINRFQQLPIRPPSKGDSRGEHLDPSRVSLSEVRE
jgi:hypothetical protein